MEVIERQKYMKNYYLQNKEKLLKVSKNYSLKTNYSTQNKYRKSHIEQVRVLRKEYKLRIRYGITPKQHELMIINQDNRCTVCKEKSTRTLQIDHDHITGKVRGLLCFNCNGALGHVKDSIFTLYKLADYLELYK